MRYKKNPLESKIINKKRKLLKEKTNSENKKEFKAKITERTSIVIS